MILKAKMDRFCTSSFAFDEKNEILYFAVYDSLNDKTSIKKLEDDKVEVIDVMSGFVRSLAYHPIFSILFVGGEFKKIDQIPTSNIAAWSSQEKEWLDCGGANGPVYCVEISTHGDSDLYVGGAFSKIGNQKETEIQKIAKLSYGQISSLSQEKEKSIPEWKGLSSQGTYPDGAIFCMAFTPFALYVGGQFKNIGSTEVNNIAKWDYENESWFPLKSGVTVTDSSSRFGAGTSCLYYDEETKLYVGGWFTKSGRKGSTGVSYWKVFDDGNERMNDWYPLAAKYFIENNLVHDMAADHNKDLYLVCSPDYDVALTEIIRLVGANHNNFTRQPLPENFPKVEFPAELFSTSQCLYIGCWAPSEEESLLQYKFSQIS